MFNFLPKDHKFFDELESLAGHVVSASRELHQIVQEFPNFDGQLREIETDRLAARELFEGTLLRLDKAFITPIDREDILNLVTEMYGVIDRISELSQRFRLYRLADLHPTLGGQSKNLSELADELGYIIAGLRKEQTLSDIKPRLDTVSSVMEMVKKDREAFLGTLFAGEPNPLDVIKKKEMHDLMEEAIERCEEATETVERVLLKNA